MSEVFCQIYVWLDYFFAKVLLIDFSRLSGFISGMMILRMLCSGRIVSRFE